MFLARKVTHTYVLEIRTTLMSKNPTTVSYCFYIIIFSSVLSCDYFFTLLKESQLLKTWHKQY